MGSNPAPRANVNFKSGQTKIIEKLQAQVGQLASAYLNTVFRREPMPNRPNPGSAEKQLEDEGFVLEK